MAVHKYDILKDTWIYQEIQQQIVEEQRQHYLDEQQQIILEIMQTRFPRIVTLTKATIQNISDPATLRTLLVQLSTARVEKEARQHLQAICTPN